MLTRGGSTLPRVVRGLKNRVSVFPCMSPGSTIQYPIYNMRVRDMSSKEASIKSFYSDLQTSGNSDLNEEKEFYGWVRSVRTQKNSCFVTINDGSTLVGMQIIVDESLVGSDMLAVCKTLTLGSSVSFIGKLHRNERKPLESTEAYELWATSIHVHGISPTDPQSIGTCPIPEYVATAYPLQKKHQTLEFLRDHTALKLRTNTYAAATRVRSKASYILTKFFNEKHYTQIHAPLITPVDCEGAGEVFSVANQELEQPYTSFFDKPAYLSVSGQLYGEIAASSLTKIFSFGPTFRAENSHTTRHLAEFWMLEPEIANADLQDICLECENSIKYTVKELLSVCQEDLAFFNERYDKTLLTRLQALVDTPFARITYTEAIAKLETAVKEHNIVFKYPITWGASLQSEHERYLAEQVFHGPVFITNYPLSQKPFYMRVNNLPDMLPMDAYNYKDLLMNTNSVETEPTAACMDLIVPGIGELCGGSQREERFPVLAARMQEYKLPAKDYGWYLDTRRYGTVKHGGWGMGFERFIAYVTGMENIRDVVLAPRAPKLMKV